MSTATITRALPYEARLNADPEWALSEGGRHFDERSSVHQSLHDIALRLSELGIPYAVAGGMAMFRHGFRRFTEDVDLLVSKENLQRIHHELEGRGYLPVFTGSKNLRDTRTGVRIEFLIAGQFPGDGKPKPVAFPHPASASIELDGVRYLRLSALIELKLASGISASHRIQDLVDVQRLISTLDLPLEFSAELNPFVRPKYEELWRIERGTPVRRLRRWPTRFPAMETMPVDELVSRLTGVDDELADMLRDGVSIEHGGNDPDYVLLVTTDPEIARKYDMHEESEFFEAGESGEAGHGDKSDDR